MGEAPSGNALACWRSARVARGFGIRDHDLDLRHRLVLLRGLDQAFACLAVVEPLRRASARVRSATSLKAERPAYDGTSDVRLLVQATCWRHRWDWTSASGLLLRESLVETGNEGSRCGESQEGQKSTSAGRRWIVDAWTIVLA